MAYKKDQGRYARMVAFWALFLLVAYGCLGGLQYVLRESFGSWFAPPAGSPEAGQGHWTIDPWIESLPLLGRFDFAVLLALLVLAGAGIAIHRFLNKPKSADLLIDTESEMRKVTWPSGGDTIAGTIAVLITVGVLLFYLTFADYVLAFVLQELMT